MAQYTHKEYTFSALFVALLIITPLSLVISVPTLILIFAIFMWQLLGSVWLYSHYISQQKTPPSLVCIASGAAGWVILALDILIARKK